MTARPDAVVVGAGVIGASCAVHLAQAGLRVVVIDRAGAPGGGSTARATGGFRAQYGTEINVRLSLLARDQLQAFRDQTGVDPGFQPVGYLWLARSAEQLDELREANALQRRTGLREAEIVGPYELCGINPYITTDGLAGGAWCPTDGVMRPTEILRGYLEAAGRLGVELRWGEPVVGLERGPGNRITAVMTPRGSHAADLVVNAAGAWAAGVARLAGVELPVEPLRRQVAVTEPTEALPSSFPMTIWLEDGFHLRVRDGRVLLLRPTPGDPDDPWSDRVEPAWLDDVAARAYARVPALRGVALDRSAAWAGLYEMTPDHHAVLGWAPGCPNFLLVNGCSGHGVMHAPALGLLASEIAVHGAARSLDVHALRPARFAEGDPVHGSALL
ncbi:MAG TPA: FAD-dependent oxidoreductase [Kofleriaceae bacterium]|nr:FAD-dependent oxidoreductase [Kofleriaceae bacterium]